jgi:hypothetical protein
MVSSEKITYYKGDNYSIPILGNKLSFADAAEMVSKIDNNTIESFWFSSWKNWIPK